MKKSLLLLLIILLSSQINIYSSDENENNEEKLRDAFRRLYLSAHPLPDESKIPDIQIPLAPPQTSGLFLNVNTIVPENDNLPVQNESSIAVNPVNPDNMIASAVDYRFNSSTKVYVSHDGGLTWENIDLGRPFPEWRSTNDPSVAFDSEGTAYLVYGGFPDMQIADPDLDGSNGVFIARSFDEGETWEAHTPVILHRGGQTPDSTFEDKYYISVDMSEESPYSGDLYIPWKRVTPRDSATQIVLSKSTDKGATWSDPVNVSYRVPGSSEDTTFGQSFPLAALGPEGELYVVWNHGIEHGVGFAKSLDGGATFSDPEIIHHYDIFGETIFIPGQGYRHSVKGKVRAEAYPVITTDVTEGPNHGNIYLCWAADNPPNIYFSKSEDKGDTWTDPVIVHSDTTNDQFWAWLAVDPTSGDLGIMYLDSRNDPDNIITECFVSYSGDGGDTWIDRKAADAGSDLRLNPFSSNAFAGDYNGCAFYNGVIYPSWVDMRNAVNNIADNDVYTAIVDIDKPAPPDNFKADVVADRPDILDLSWKNPTEKAFGQPLSPDEYSLELFRGAELIAELESDQNTYSDSGLEMFEKYDYSIRAVTEDDSSTFALAEGFAGGAREPNAPSIASFDYMQEYISVNVVIPAMRIDNSTPIVNLKNAVLLRDRTDEFTYDLDPSDTGKTVNLDNQIDVPGYYTYNAKITDHLDVDGGLDLESKYGEENIYYAGDISSSLSENFDGDEISKFFTGGAWQLTDEFARSAPYSITESPGGDYGEFENDTLMIFPVEFPESGKLQLTFWHAALVKRFDFAYLEVYDPESEKWDVITNYDENDYDPWKDGILDQNDWKYETIELEGDAGTETTVRFRFSSNALQHSDGWYIDDINISAVNSVAENPAGSDAEIFPNPASNFLTIHSGSGITRAIDKIMIFDSFGNILNTEDLILSKNANSVVLNISNISSGMYYLKIVYENNKTELKKLSVVK